MAHVSPAEDVLVVATTNGAQPSVLSTVKTEVGGPVIQICFENVLVPQGLFAVRVIV